VERAWRDSSRVRVLMLLLVGTATVLLSCSRSPSGPGPAGDSAALSPRATLKRLIELREERQYGELPRLVVPNGGGDVVEFLMAVDGFLASNRRLGRSGALRRRGAGRFQPRY